jgi:uncharacterized membrane protein (DUF4010 family)
MLGGEIIGFIVAIFLGALIGLQREYTQQHLRVKSFAGIRTFVFATFFGAILGFLSEGFNSLWVILGFAGIILFSVASYVVIYMKSGKISGTTQISFILAYVLGVMCTTGNSELAVVFGIIIATFLTFKERLHDFAKRMKGSEIVGMVKFALIAFVVLPFLPNKNFSPMDILGLSDLLVGLGANVDFLVQLDVFNPYKIWFMVIFIAGINLLGYFLVKLVGSKKGYGILGFVGGLVSSTAVTLSMAEESKRYRKVLTPFLLATIVAAAVMFVRVILEVAVINNSLLPSLFLPMGVMALFSFFVAGFFYRRRDKKKRAKGVELRQPFALKPALIFGLFFALILVVVRVAQLLFGEAGIYVTSILSGLMDVDAITLTMAALSKDGGISDSVATIAIMLAAASNTIVKGGMAYFLGNKRFGKYVLIAFGVILLVGMLTLFLF